MRIRSSFSTGEKIKKTILITVCINCIIDTNKMFNCTDRKSAKSKRQKCAKPVEQYTVLWSQTYYNLYNPITVNHLTGWAEQNVLWFIGLLLKGGRGVAL